ncbi:MAG TPA: ATP synthase subunit I [Polyangiaceae bacterium]|nr:ATP synthase subunit I [Polyangiaceae bacterium]
MTTSFAVATIFGPLGVLLGAAHFAGLRRGAVLYLARGRRVQVVGLHVLRITVTVASLTAIGSLGAAALLSAFAGLWLGRQVVIARYWRVS